MCVASKDTEKERERKKGCEWNDWVWLYNQNKSHVRYEEDNKRQEIARVRDRTTSFDEQFKSLFYWLVVSSSTAQFRSLHDKNLKKKNKGNYTTKKLGDLCSCDLNFHFSLVFRLFFLSHTPARLHTHTTRTKHQNDLLLLVLMLSRRRHLRCIEQFSAFLTSFFRPLFRKWVRKNVHKIHNGNHWKI